MGKGVGSSTRVIRGLWMELESSRQVSASRMPALFHFGHLPSSFFSFLLSLFSVLPFASLRLCAFAFPSSVPLLRFRFFGSPLRSAKRVDPLHLAHFSFKV